MFKIAISLRLIEINNKQGKPLASSLCDKTTGRLIRQHQNVKLSFGQNFQKGLK